MWLLVALSLTTNDGRPSVMVTIPACKCTDVVKEIDELLDAAGMVQEKRIQRVAGRADWIAGFVPGPRPSRRSFTPQRIASYQR